MALSPLVLRKLKTLLIICIFSMFAGMIFQRLNEGFIDHNAFTIGLSMGFGFGIMELFMMAKFDRRLKNAPVLLAIITKTFIYTVIIYLISSTGALTRGIIDGQTIDEFYEIQFSSAQLHLILYSLIVVSIVIFFLQIGRLLGEGVLFKILLGKYHRPIAEERIFMFLDIKSSTTIAEQLGHDKYYSLINSFFAELTVPVLNTQAEIYQYVGDEVVLTWEAKQGIQDANCLQVFFLIKRNIEEHCEDYSRKYGVVPQFKAGVHSGKVITGEIGDLKREIVYNGDVLNTTARILELCNEYDQDLLISSSLLSQFQLPKYLEKKSLGKLKLRGKGNEIHVFAISKKWE